MRALGLQITDSHGGDRASRSGFGVAGAACPLAAVELCLPQPSAARLPTESPGSRLRGRIRVGTGTLQQGQPAEGTHPCGHRDAAASRPASVRIHSSRDEPWELLTGAAHTHSVLEATK